MLKVFNITQSREWDCVIRSFYEYDVYWLSGYVKAFQINGDGEPLLFYYESPDTRGINVVMKRDIAKESRFKESVPENTLFDFATPYGYGGWIIEGTNTTSLFSEYENWCRKNNIVCEFVRFHPVIKNHIYAQNKYEVAALGQTVAMDLASPEIIWNNISSKNRNVIRKAEKSGVRIFNGRNPALFDEFKKIYDNTMYRDNAEEYYFFGDEFYESICFDLAENTQVFYAEKDGRIIATSIMIAANGRMNYHLSGSLAEFRSFAPSNLLVYKAALWGSAHGQKTLHLGGGVGSGEDNLFKFKRAFYRGNLQTFHIGKKVFLDDIYSELVELRGPVDSNFFPKYRA